MARISIKTLEKKVSQAGVFYGQQDVSPRDFFRWLTSPFLARIFLNINCEDKLFKKISQDIGQDRNKDIPTREIQLEKTVSSIEKKGRIFLKRSRYISGGLVALTTLLILLSNAGNQTLWQALIHASGMIWVVFIISSIIIMQASEAISESYVSKLPEYKNLLAYLHPLFINYKNTLEFWNNLSWQNFEREATKRLNQLGYDAINTKLSGDEGVDIIINNQNRKFIIQCKAMKGKVGPSYVRDFVGTMEIQNAVGGMIISLNGFSDGSLGASDGRNIYLLSIEDFVLLDRDKLSKIIGW